MTEYKSLEQPLNDQQENRIIVDREYLEELKRTCRELWLKQQKVIALIKDGRFVEALQELDGK